MLYIIFRITGGRLRMQQSHIQINKLYKKEKKTGHSLHEQMNQGQLPQSSFTLCNILCQQAEQQTIFTGNDTESQTHILTFHVIR